jgi:hypothetical protein
MTLKRKERGSVLPLIAACIAVLMGFGGIAVDVGFLEFRQQTQQSATDAAAVGGAQQLARGSCANGSVAEAASLADAATNGFATGNNGVTVSVQNPPTSGPYANNGCAISVQIASTQPTFFARLFGFANGMGETTAATGLVSSNSLDCLYFLSTSSWTNFNNATVSAPGCGIDINYTSSFNGGTITSPFIGYAGGTPNWGGTTFPQASPVPMLPVADPCPEIAGCAYFTANPPPATNCQTINQNGVPMTLNHGCYQNLNLNAPTTLNPGIYVISGNMNLNSGYTLTGSGVTIYVPSGGNGPNFDGGTVNLSPPTSGAGAGVLYYQVPSNSASINFNGPNVKLAGLIYAPGSNSVNFDAANGNYVVLVVGSANFNQGNPYDFASPPPGQSLVNQAVLAQ